MFYVRLSVMFVVLGLAICSATDAGETTTLAPKTDPVSFADMHTGLFVHYANAFRPYGCTLTTWADGTPIRTLDELADNLDVEDLAAAAADMRAQYVQFTTWHANMNALFPSKVLAKRLPGHCSRRDVIVDLIKALRAKNIRLILYIHPSDGHDFSREDQDRVGWNDPAPHARWNDFINEVIAEVVDRYGKDVSGYYIDGGLPPQVDPARLRKTILQRQPKAWLIQNGGLNPACVDYGSSEEQPQARGWPTTPWQQGVVVGGCYWANQGYAWLRPEFAYQYMLLQSTVSMGGGTAWACGPYPQGQWEPGVRDFMRRLGALVDKAGPSFRDARPSKAYVTTPGQGMVGKDVVTKAGQGRVGLRFVATESPDGKRTYLHVFVPPRDRILRLSPPANGQQFSRAHLLAGNAPVGLSQTKTALQLTIGDPDRWDDVDTIIVLE